MAKQCCIKNCRSVYRPGVVNNRSLFGFPKDEENYTLWKIAISPYTENATKRSHVCDLHFDVSNFEESDIVIAVDGAERTVPRKRRRLKKGSVPSIFDKKNQEPETTSAPQPQQSDPGTSSDPLSAIDDSSWSYDMPALVNDVFNLGTEGRPELPQWWEVMALPLGVLFTYMGDTFCHVSRSVFVKQDMTVEFRIQGRVSHLWREEKMTNFEVVHTLLSTISGYILCQGVNGDHDCCGNGFIESATPVKTTRCGSCRLAHRRELDRAKKRATRTIVKENKTANELRNLRRNLKRAQQKIIQYRDVALTARNVFLEDLPEIDYSGFKNHLLKRKISK